MAKNLAAKGIFVEVVTDLPSDARFVIDLRGVNPVKNVDEALAMNTACFSTAAQIGAQLVSQEGLLVVVQNTGGCFAINHDAGMRVWSAGIAGLAKTAAKEWPNATVKVIDIDAEALDKKQIAQYLFEELLMGGDELEVCIDRHGLRQTPILLSEEKTVFESEAVSSTGVILVSGGARGVTTACLQELFKRYPMFNVALLGRTMLVDEPDFLTACSSDMEIKRALLRDYQSKGQHISPLALNQEAQKILNARTIKANVVLLKSMCKVCEYFSTDINDLNALTQTVNNIRKSMGPIEGIIHAAGVLADQYIHKKNLDDYYNVFNTKVVGIKNLLAVTKSDTLYYFSCFSSIAARAGNQGQVDYAMANEILNKVCQQFKWQHPNCCVTSFNWGPWDGGMVSPQLKVHFEEEGVGLISLSEGGEVFANNFVARHDSIELIVGVGLEQMANVKIQKEHFEFFKYIHKNTAPLFINHKIWGVPVVPLVFLIEWTYEALANAVSSNQISFSKISSSNAIKLDCFGTTGNWLRLEALIDSSNKWIVSFYPNSEKKPYSNLTVQINPLPHSINQEQPNFDVLRFTREISSPVFEHSRIYSAILFHKDCFKVVRSVDSLNDKVLYATLQLVSNDNTALNAMYLDGALQLGLIAMYAKYKCAALPIAIEKINFYRRCSGEKVYCRCDITESSALSIITNVSLFDENGYLLVSFEGIRSLAIEGYQYLDRTESLEVEQ